MISLKDRSLSRRMVGMGSEHATIRLDRPVPGLDHIKAVDQTELCSVLYSVDEDAEYLDLDSVKGFCIWPGQRPRWWPASAGLKTIRGLIADYEPRIASGSDARSGTRNSALPGYLNIL